MIRQARTYLVSAMSGAGLIAIAIAVFVVLVSTQVFRDWPLAALGDKPDDSAAVSSARPAAGSSGVQASRVKTTQEAPGGAAANSGAGSAENGGGGQGAGVQAGAPAVDQAPSGEGGNGEAGGGNGGSNGGGSNGGGSGGSGGGGGSQNPTSAPESSSSSGGSTGTGKGGGEESSGSGSLPTPSSASGTITETVNGTVNQVDETVLGGTLEETGVTNVTEGVVNGVAGPNSLVGHVLDETVHAVEGLVKPPGS